MNAAGLELVAASERGRKTRAWAGAGANDDSVVSVGERRPGLVWTTKGGGGEV